MTATFLLPFAMGACQAVGGNIVQDAFGVVAMVAMTPLITIQADAMGDADTGAEAPVIMGYDAEEEEVSALEDERISGHGKHLFYFFCSITHIFSLPAPSFSEVPTR